MDKLCRNCAHWEFEENDPLGEGRVMMHCGASGGCADLSGMWGFPDCMPVHTGPDFGCVNFEPKESA